MKTTSLFAPVVAALVFTASVHAVTIDLVPVGNPGNAPDTRYNSISVGSVANAYQIGNYEVTAGQYTEFLNAVADADPNELYNTDMVNTFGANIQRTGSSPTYSYSVAADWANRPVNHVSFWDAARFANWLHNGQPTGAQGPTTTEGGAYHDVGNQTLFGRNASALFFIPTEDEWYKAAYHDKTAGLAATYFDYPTGTNAEPGIDINETTNPGNNANYFISNYVIGSPYYRTVAGEFELSDSTYGTFDQGGNVWEWNETKVTSSWRRMRGGSFLFDSSYFLHAFARRDVAPSSEFINVGFRVASIPEPASVTGDYNLDGVVDAADYVVWRDTVSQLASPPGSGADGNANGMIDAGDYDFWKARFGSVVSGASGSGGFGVANIPEPGSLTLSILGVMALVLRRRR